MTVVSYRIHCDECDNEVVIQESEADDSDWKVRSRIHHTGLCPECNPLSSVAAEGDSESESIALTELDSIGEKAAQNLTEAGYDTAEAIRAASDKELLGVSWVGEKGLESLRQATKPEPQRRWSE